MPNFKDLTITLNHKIKLSYDLSSQIFLRCCMLIFTFITDMEWSGSWWLKCQNIIIFREISKNVLYININIINGCLNFIFFNSSEMNRHNLKTLHTNKLMHKRGFNATQLHWVGLIYLFLDNQEVGVVLVFIIDWLSNDSPYLI